METPYVTHLTSEDYEHIYEPAEDSFLMIDALELELDFIKKLKPAICCEIGSGSGINIAALSKALNNESYFIATDINPYATKCTSRTAEFNDVLVNAIQMDLISSLIPRSIDVLIFNPPYVPTTTSISALHQSHDESNFQVTDMDANLIKAWAGGINGREVMDRVINVLDAVLSSNGVFYLLVVKENDIPNIVKKLKELGFTGEVILDRRIRGEHLFVIKITRT